MRLIAAAVAVVVLLGGCVDPPRSPPPTVVGGDVRRGATAIERHGCASCHFIPGIRRAEVSWVAPPLTKYAQRRFVAGVLLNNQENLMLWIMDPKAVDPETGMPDLDVTEVEARDIAAYLYSLR